MNLSEAALVADALTDRWGFFFFVLFGITSPQLLHITMTASLSARQIISIVGTLHSTTVILD